MRGTTIFNVPFCAFITGSHYENSGIHLEDSDLHHENSNLLHVKFRYASYVIRFTAREFRFIFSKDSHNLTSVLAFHAVS